jgi:3D (Asp-Asp-Asp) domain-containing protein
MFRQIFPKTLLATLFLSGCATHQQCSKSSKCGSSELAAGTIKTVRTTAYINDEPGGGRSACGKRLCATNKDGKVKSAAADWSRFPLGTRFQLVSTGEIYEICDYGSALVGKNTIDLYKSSRHEMRKWGARYVDIKILQWGSRKKSMEVLAPRHSSHVRAMMCELSQET